MQFEEKADLVVDATKDYLIYFLLKENDVVYVGQTTRNLLRPFAHKDKIFDSVAIIYQAEDRELLNEVEEFYIKKYSPKYNKVFNPDGYANQVITDYAEIEKIKQLSSYFMNLEQVNEQLKEHGLYELTKRDYKRLKKMGFKFFNNLVMMDPHSFLRLMKMQVQPSKFIKRHKMNFSETVESILKDMSYGEDCIF